MIVILTAAEFFIGCIILYVAAGRIPRHSQQFNLLRVLELLVGTFLWSAPAFYIIIISLMHGGATGVVVSIMVAFCALIGGPVIFLKIRKYCGTFSPDQSATHARVSSVSKSGTEADGAEK